MLSISHAGSTAFRLAWYKQLLRPCTLPIHCVATQTKTMEALPYYATLHRVKGQAKVRRATSSSSPRCPFRYHWSKQSITHQPTLHHIQSLPCVTGAIATLAKQDSLSLYQDSKSRVGLKHFNTYHYIATQQGPRNNYRNRTILAISHGILVPKRASVGRPPYCSFSTHIRTSLICIARNYESNLEL